MLGKETFEMNKGEYSKKLGRIIANHRANSRLLGEPREFVLRSCRLVEQWAKMAHDPECVVYLRNLELAGGRRVKMLSLERGRSKQPISKAKLIESLYPTKKIATSATPEQKHFALVKAAMRNAVHYQLQEYKMGTTYPVECLITGRMLPRGARVDIDHFGKPFAQIADEFLQSRDLHYVDIVVVGPPSNKRFKDEVLWIDWKEFHKKEARFALVCASANRSKGASGYETPSELIGSFASCEEDEISLDF